MAIKTTTIYSPNFDLKKRKKNNIKFLVFHYTGMKRENEAIKRLTQIQSEVGAHYYIKKNGEIIKMVPELYTAWHAGISQWGKYKSINKCSMVLKFQTQDINLAMLTFLKNKLII